jgi:uncharacterized protein YegP (UPF0339 family)
MAAIFELKQTKGGKFAFNLKATNGQVILTSQQYKQKTSAQNGIESVRKSAADDANFERSTSSSSQPYFVLKAANGQIIGTSEMYSSDSAMENGIRSVKKNAPSALIDDIVA